MYYRLLLEVNPDEGDFIEACDRIMIEDDWFPTVARIRDVTRLCAAERRQRAEAVERQSAQERIANWQITCSGTFPDWLEALRNPLTGKIDMELLYRKSRELRGLDPDVDERPRAVPGWKSAGHVAARELVGR